MAMDLRYEFELTMPAAQHSLKIGGHDREGLLIATSFAGARRELSDLSLLTRFLTHPLLTLKVVVGIHFEALLLWIKGVALVPRPAPPAALVTFVSGPHVRKKHATDMV